MSDSIKRSGSPGSADDVAARPDVGFHDDHVGGHIKAEEAAKKRAALGVMQRRPKRIETEPEKVGEVLHYRGTEDDKAAQEQRAQRGLVQGKAPMRAKPRPKASNASMYAVDQDVRRIEERVDLLMTTLSHLEGVAQQGQERSPPPGTEAQARLALMAARQQKEANEARGAALAGEEGLQVEHRLVERLGEEPDEERDQQQHQNFEQWPQEETQGEELDAAAAAARWQRTARDMRFLLQHLIAGGVGLVLSPDPAATFKHLFERLKSWPQKIPPGHVPASAADYDAFLAWVFAPERGHENLISAVDAELPR